MTRLLGIIAAALLLGVAPVRAAEVQPPSAKLNYTMHCMGCHKADGSGQGKFVPAVTGKMAQFLALPLGRDYLARVPGSAQSMLNDRELADLLNWMLHEFDASHIPAGFEPYTADEVGMLRRSPLSNPSRTRQRLANELDAAAAAQHYLDK